MRTSVFLGFAALVCLPIVGDTVSQPSPQEIIQKFSAKEAEFAAARNNYTYRQSVKIEEVEPRCGKYELVEDIIFSPDGKRMEKVVRAPVNGLRNILLTPEDEQDLRNVQPFVLTTKEIPEYEINYIGKKKIDEIPCFEFAVRPKKMEKGKRYFEGQIWVDDRDLQIVKTYGRGVGIVGKNNRFPKFETYREQIDNKYWFPTYTHADDVLHFQDSDQRIKMTVKYEDYKKYEGKSTIKFGDVVDEPTKTTTPPANPPKK